MRNLKRALSLALAAVMVLGLMIVGAGAADVYDDFTDKDEIQHVEAVKTLVSLNVINGKDTGGYDPTGTLTRAEMAKLVTYVMNGGNEPVLNVKDTPTYSDIDNHWAEKYIEYCTSQGIIAGDGAGKFNPEGTLTGSQAAKMLLVAMGYNANVFGFTGTNWELNTNKEANAAGLYDDLGGLDPSEPISRDDAAQLVYNAVQAPLMERTWSQDKETGAITEIYTPAVTNGVTTNSLLIDKFNGDIEYGYLTGFSYDESKAVWTYTFSAGANFGGAAITKDAYSGGAIKSSVDYTALYGQQVKIIYKTTTNDVVYGVYANDSAVVAQGYTGNLPTTIAATDDSVKFDGTSYKLNSRADQIPVYTYNGSLTAANVLSDLNSAANLAVVRLVDNNGDTKVDAIVTNPVSVAKVSYVSSTSITFTALTGFAAIGSKDVDDINVYEGVAQNDYVLYTDSAYAPTEMPTIVKLDVATGTISGTKEGNQFLVDGTWLTNTTSTTLSSGDNIEYIALGNRIYYAKVVDSTSGSRSVGMIYNVGITTGGGVTDKAVEASIIFTNGTKQTIIIDKVNGVDVEALVKNNTITSASAGNVNAGVAVSGASIGANTLQNLLVGELVNYKVDNDGHYEVSNLDDGSGYAAPTNGDILGYKGVTANSTFTSSNNAVGGKEVADDAVVFVFEGAAAHTASSDNSAYVYTGKQLKDTKQVFGDTDYVDYGSALYGTVDGFSYAQVVVLGDTAKPGILTGANYGYLVSDAYTGYEDGKTYTYFTYWDGTQEVTAKAEGDSISDFKAGAVITFDNVGEGLIKNVSVPSSLVTGKVTGWDNNKKISLDGSNYELSDDTVILYVDSGDKKGQAGDRGLINLAADMDTTLAGDENNVRYITVGNPGVAVALLLVDVDNYMKPAPAVSVSTLSDALTILNNGGNVTYTSASVNATDMATLLAALGASQTLTINGNAAAPAAATTLNGTLKVTGTFTADGTYAFTIGATGTLQVNVLTDSADKVTTTSSSAAVVIGTSGTAGNTGKWYSDAGKNCTSAGNDGVPGTTSATVAAGTYKWGTVYTGNDGTTSSAWILQK